MIIEKGVDMIKVCEQLKKVLPVIDHVFFQFGNSLVIIATSWGKDKHRVAHESGEAIDIVRPLSNPSETFNHLKDCLGVNYFVKRLDTHWHVSYFPQGKSRMTTSQADFFQPGEVGYHRIASMRTRGHVGP